MKVIWWTAHVFGIVVGIPLLIIVALVFALHLFFVGVHWMVGLLMEHMTGATLDWFTVLREKLQRRARR